MINVGEKLPPHHAQRARSSGAVAGEAVGRMPRIAAAILPAHIGDGGVGTLALHFERSNQRVLRIDGDAVGFALGDEAHGVMTRHVLNLPPWSIVPQPKMSMRRRLCAVALPLCISGVDGASPGLELFSSVPDFAGCWKVSGRRSGGLRLGHRLGGRGLGKLARHRLAIAETVDVWAKALDDLPLEFDWHLVFGDAMLLLRVEIDLHRRLGGGEVADVETRIDVAHG